MSSCTDLASFLNQYKYIKGGENKITHTRIGDKSKNIYGGCWSIPKKARSVFYKLYYKHIYEFENPEYLTESQLQNKGPILLDFDFRYSSSIKKRQHSTSHILDLIQLYIETLKEILNFDQSTVKFNIYIFEKPKPRTVQTKTGNEVTKDGVHVIIGLTLDHSVQLFLRNQILGKINDIWSDLPLVNPWEEVLDEGITAGYTNWQLHGSKKPNNTAYQLKKLYTCTIKNDKEQDYELNSEDVDDFDYETRLMELSAQNTKQPYFGIKPNLKTELKQYEKKKQSSSSSKKKFIQMDKIKNMDQLDAAVDELLKIGNDDFYRSEKGVTLKLGKNERDERGGHVTDHYYIIETHNFTMLLPEKFYGPGSEPLWIRVGWALRNTHPRLFITWMKFSSQSKDFSFEDIPKYYELWQNMDRDEGTKLTNKSIMFWAKTWGDKERFNEIYKNTVEYFVNETIKTPIPTDFDFAQVLYHLKKDKYICVSVKNNIWYEFKNHRWHENDSGSGLRLSISKEMHQIYQELMMKYLQLSAELPTSIEVNGKDEPNPEWQKAKEKTSQIATIAMKLKKTTDKNYIMRESRELFYDKNFLEEQDNNPYLLGFNNGIFDFNENIFRPGDPTDYVVKSTKFNYVSLEKLNEKEEGTKSIKEVDEFMEQLFPVKELRDYMWEHLASTLIGTNNNQTFNIYTGSGRNGKSMLVALMSKVLGDYKGTVPITLITQKRPSIGSSSSEVVALKGVRYAVMQEPSKGDKINEGIMKEITGSDPLQGRALYQSSCVFIPQFKLVVCTNTLFAIVSNDDGTWRRIRVCDFMSKFKEKPVKNDKDEPYQFKVNKKLEDKFDKWKVAFMAKLVDIAKKSKGDVKDCDIVMAKSNEYREDQDYLSSFIKENIKEDLEGNVKKQQLNKIFRRWYQVQFSGNPPASKELFDFMNKRYGKYNLQKGWKNISIIEDDEEDE